jgi:hypothetical protein
MEATDSRRSQLASLSDPTLQGKQYASGTRALHVGDSFLIDLIESSENRVRSSSPHEQYNFGSYSIICLSASALTCNQMNTRSSSLLNHLSGILCLWFPH